MRKQTGHVRSACFACWWRWEQRSLHAKRKQTMEDLGARAGQVLSEQGLVPDVKGLYTIQCPSCRFALARTSPMMHCSCNSCASQQPACQAQADARGLGCPGWAGAGRAGPGARRQGALHSTVPSCSYLCLACPQTESLRLLPVIMHIGPYPGNLSIASACDYLCACSPQVALLLMCFLTWAGSA